MAITRTFQDRLGRFQDKLKSKMIDNSIALSGQAVDTIRIKIKKNRNGDLVSREIISNDVIPVMFPALIEIPMRVIEKTDPVKGSFKINSLNLTDSFPIEIYTPISSSTDPGDLLIRILRNEMDEAKPYVVCLEVKDAMGTFGVSQLMWKKMICTTYDEYLPEEIVNIVASMAERRYNLLW